MKKTFAVIAFSVFLCAVFVPGCGKNSTGPAPVSSVTNTFTLTPAATLTDTITGTATCSPTATLTSTNTPVVKIIAEISNLGNETVPQYSVYLYHDNVAYPSATVIVSNITAGTSVTLNYSAGSYYAIASDGAEYTPDNVYRIYVETNGKTYYTEGVAKGGITISDWSSGSGVNVNCQSSGDGDDIEVQGNSPSYPQIFYATEVGNPQFVYPVNIPDSVLVPVDNTIFARVYYTVQNSFNYSIDPASYLQFYAVKLKTVYLP